MADWPKQRQDEALAAYASAYGVTVFTDVPVTRSRWKDWPDDTHERRVAVAVGSPGATVGGVEDFDEALFVAAVAGPHPVRPLVARGYADRTVFGEMVTRQAFLARSWRPRGEVLPVALTGRSGPASNVAPAYRARGFEIWAATSSSSPRGEVVAPGSASRGGGGKDPWMAPGRGEDQLLNQLWVRRQREGWWLAEVPVGGVSAGDGGSRRLDAIVVRLPGPRHSRGGADLHELAAVVATGCEVELIEAKRHLTSAAIGQLLSGAHLFTESWPGHGALGHTLCVEHLNDYAVQWFCAQAGIRIERVDAPPM